MRSLGLEGLLIVLVVGLLGVDLTYSGMFNPQESLLIQAGREIALTNHWGIPTLHGKPFFQTPPLFAWLLAGAFKLFGAHLWTARALSLLSAGLALLFAVGLSRQIFAGRSASLATLLVAASSWGLYHTGRLASDDMLCVMLVLAYQWLFLGWYALSDRPRFFAWQLRQYALALGIVLGLVGLCKGLAATLLLILFSCLFLVLRQTLYRLRVINYRLLLSALLPLSLGWPIWLYTQGYADEALRYVVLQAGFSWTSAAVGFGNPLEAMARLMIDLLPWTLFFVIALWDLLAGRKLAYESPDGFVLLLVAALGGLSATVLYPDNMAAGVLLLVFACAALIGSYLGRELEEGWKSVPLRLSMDAMTVFLIIASVAFTLVIFQVFPDDWSPLGTSVADTREKLSDLFPIWKLRFIPGSLWLALGGIVLYVLSLLRRYTLTPMIIALNGLLFWVFVSLTVTPYLQDPIGKKLAGAMAQQAHQQPERRILVYTGQPQVTQALFFLPETLFKRLEAKKDRHRLERCILRSMGQPAQSLPLGVFHEALYYELPADLRHRLRVLAHFPLSRFGDNLLAWSWGLHSQTRGEVLIYEVLPAQPTEP